jgi:hypothetical protein
MKFVRTLALLLLTALLISACGKDEAETQQVAEPVAGTSDQNSLLELVPADTPYLAGNLAPVPDAIIDSYLKRFEPALISLQAELGAAKAELESNPEALADNPEQRFVHALLQEMDGKLNRAGLESLGFDLSSEQVVYGMSAFPVTRVSLSDSAALRATVQRVLDNAKITAPQLEFQGQSYWRIVPETDHEDGDHANDAAEYAEDPDSQSSEDGGSEAEAAGESNIAIYIAILQDHLAMGVLPIAAESTTLPAFLALEKPDNSLAASTLSDINKRFKYTPYGTGVLDLQKLVDELLNPQTLAGQTLASEGHDLASGMTDQCRTEINGIIANTPFFYTGITELSETVVANQMVMQTEATLAGELINLVSDVPAASPESSYLAELALGLKVGPVRDFLRNKATAIVTQPYQCEFLQNMNEYAQQASDQLNQPIPPMVNNLLGLRAAISRIGSPDAPQSAEGMVALHVTQPEMLIGMAQMLVPTLAELNLAPGEPPVQVPADMLPFPDLVLFAAQSESAIGLAVGEGQQNTLVDFINQKGTSGGTFLSVNYDTATYLQMTADLTEDVLDESGHSAPDGFTESAKAVYESIADRSDTRIGFNSDGLVIDSKMTFKNP